MRRLAHRVGDSRPVSVQVEYHGQVADDRDRIATVEVRALLASRSSRRSREDIRRFLPHWTYVSSDCPQVVQNQSWPRR